MAVHQSKHQSDLEKRLKILRQQVYGKQEWEAGSGKSHLPLRAAGIASGDARQIPASSLREAGHISLPTSDISYLYHDLLKISFLASLALGAQIILFYLLQNNFLKINLF